MTFCLSSIVFSQNFIKMTSSSVFDLVVSCAKNSPESLAIYCPENTCLTYSQLIDKCLKLKEVLNKWVLKLFGKECHDTPLILLRASRNTSIIIGILGIFASNCAYVPIDCENPINRQNLIAKSSQCRIAIIDQDTVKDKNKTLVEALNSESLNLEDIGLSTYIEVIIIIDDSGQIIYVKHFKNLHENTNEILTRDATNNEVIGTKADKKKELAYVMFTSGSTGIPKGVNVTVNNLMIALESFSILLKLESSDVLLAVTTYAFDISILELIYPLIEGACVFIAPLHVTTSGIDLCKLLNNPTSTSSLSSISSETHGVDELNLMNKSSVVSPGIDLKLQPKVTIMQATPATWKLVMSAGWQGNTSVQVLCGGESFPKDIFTSSIIRNCKNVYNLYGPTEATIWCLAYKLPQLNNHITGSEQAEENVNNINDKVKTLFSKEDNVEFMNKLYSGVPIGCPLELKQNNGNIICKVMNDAHGEVCDGEIGELWIGGPGVALGYTDDVLTQERFIYWPESENGNDESDDATEKNNEKVWFYKSGDIVIRHPKTKLLYYVRRKDDLDQFVKVNGFRIELGEIESNIFNLKHIIRVRSGTLSSNGYLLNAASEDGDRGGGSDEERGGGSDGLLLIKDCAVIAVPISLDGSLKKLVSYVIIKEMKSTSRDTEIVDSVSSLHLQIYLKELLSNSLPSYMIPNKWIFMRDNDIDITESILKKGDFSDGKLPLNSNGKLDRNQLINMALEQQENEEKSVLCLVNQISNSDSLLGDMIEVVKAAVRHVVFDVDHSTENGNVHNELLDNHIHGGNIDDKNSFECLDDDLDLESFGISSIGVVQFLSYLSRILSHQFINDKPREENSEIEISPVILQTHKTIIDLARYLVFDRGLKLNNANMYPKKIHKQEQEEQRVGDDNGDNQANQSDIEDNSHHIANRKRNSSSDHVLNSTDNDIVPSGSRERNNKKKKKSKQKTVVSSTHNTLDIGLQACKDGDIDVIRMLLENNKIHKINNHGNETGTRHHNEADGTKSHDNVSDSVSGGGGSSESLLPGAIWDVETVDRFGSPGLHWAASGGYLDICKLLVGENGNANVFKKDKKSGRSALHWAARQGQLHVVKWLVEECQLSVHENTKDETSVFHLAVWGGHMDTCEWLVDRQVNIHHLNSWQCNAAHFASLAGHLHVLRWLHQKGLDVSNTNNQGHNALHKAAYGGHQLLCEWLQDGPVGLDRLSCISDVRGQNPATLAKKAGFDDLSTWLLRHNTEN